MHIPDGFLDRNVIATTGALAAATLAAALFRANRSLPARKVPLMGLSAAFVFAAQMINFPVAGGTSGHLIGGVLTAVLLGPSAAVIVLAAVLIVQALLFGDGGITALGANLVNMGLVGGVLGFGVYDLLRRLSPKMPWRLASAAIAAWVATEIAALCCAGELAASGTVPLRTVLPAMAGWHALIGVGEAVITVMVLASVAAARPELLERQPVSAGPSFYTATAAYGLLLALALALFASPWASKSPDGLEFVARRQNFAAAERKLVATPFSEYTAVAGAVGTVVVFGGCLLLAKAVSRRKPADAPART